MKAYILSLGSSQADLATVGGKGAALAQMVAAGLPVPDGFHITTQAYRAFVAANGLSDVIGTALDQVDVDTPSSLTAAENAIRKAFVSAPTPPDVAAAIAQAYAGLAGPLPVVAVRSSATAEDLPDLSFAGQQDTYLNISGVDDVLASTKHCWASLWT
ncbi:MAG: pyruvate, phosphate dikinase, partial [Anaerolineae bacterium]|nr:pyruvate, phosphate dikinase [Anaerolineae bacterium]